MSIDRRNLLVSTLFGAGYVGLRALVTGIPAAVLLRGPRVLADVSAAAPTNPQFVILQTSGNGDPINANAPGTYADPKIVHSLDPSMAPTAMTIGGHQTKAALPWSTLPQAVLDRASFWHIMTNTPVHPREPDVLSLLNTTKGNEMLPSLLAKQLAQPLGTVQQQPITLGASTPSEGLRFGGQALPIIPPLALKATLTSPTGPLANLAALQRMRDQTLAQLDDIYRETATKAQKTYLDALITSQAQVRGINQDLLGALGTIKDNSVASQITAAIVLIQMKVTPVVAIHIPFGGDNHSDALLATEAKQTVAGVASIAALMAQLQAAGLQDQVSLISLNVFGRTLGPGNEDGRQHNQNHQVSFAIGKPFKGGIVGGVAPVGADYGATAIDSATGAGKAGGDIAPPDTLASFGKTLLAAVGSDPAFIDGAITFGKVVPGALA